MEIHLELRNWMLGDTCSPGQASCRDKHQEMAKTSLLAVEAEHRIKLHGWALSKAAAAPAFHTETLHETSVRHTQFLPDVQTQLNFQKLTFQEKKPLVPPLIPYPSCLRCQLPPEFIYTESRRNCNSFLCVMHQFKQSTAWLNQFYPVCTGAAKCSTNSTHLSSKDQPLGHQRMNSDQVLTVALFPSRNIVLSFCSTTLWAWQLQKMGTICVNSSQECREAVFLFSTS